MTNQKDFLLRREFYRLIEEYNRCTLTHIKGEIKKDILLLEEVLNGEDTFI
ncbi:hypothetical protein IUK39_00325 [Priestia aryabhattai]|uniref:hypothetical protein n=1 Tax=Priestia aryabhattai TaxID=412384 RepID=UPI001C0D049A|nr:hypothetical protein [Priestia aryabhattai]MBU3568634.1 hypothetical protein [Priestia aryabhattai]